MELILQVDGNAYQMQEGALMTAGILANGAVDDDWCEVAFDSISAEEVSRCLRIKQMLQKLAFDELAGTAPHEQGNEETMTLEEVANKIWESLIRSEGKSVEAIHNQIFEEQVEYVEDSMFRIINKG
jgi:hypothetical protein